MRCPHGLVAIELCEPCIALGNDTEHARASDGYDALESALRAILAAWDADRGTSALRNSSALVEAIAQARELVQP